MQPLTLRSFARAIVHIDADAFFASCEQAVNPTLKGKPVVTGKERGIASAVSYEAKARGVKRGMTIREIKALCPDAIPYGQNIRTHLPTGSYSSTIACASACLPLPSDP
jgi:nucleotidyltransferase/DNA polymerase involved in DNA repair